MSLIYLKYVHVYLRTYEEDLSYTEVLAKWYVRGGESKLWYHVIHRPTYLPVFHWVYYKWARYSLLTMAVLAFIFKQYYIYPEYML